MLQKICFGLVFTFTTLLDFRPFLAAASKIRLIHHDSISSPVLRRKLYLPPTDDIRGPLSPDKAQSIFLVNVSIGEPPVPQLLAMDTGSALTWVCTTCATTLGPGFDPKKSSTYMTISCASTYKCLSYHEQSRCRDSQCYYRVMYVDGSYSNGFLATEKFTFETSSGGLVQLPNTLFGYGVDNKWNNLYPLSGTLGLKLFGEDSLLTMVGKKFSYCLGNISDPSYMYNHLILGDEATFEGPSTPIRKKGDQYLVSLEGISVGEEQLQIDKKEFGYNSLIDSGTTPTILTRGLLDPLKDEVKKLLDGFLQTVKLSYYELCYSGNLARDLKGFPTVTLHFAEGVDLDLNVEALFRRVNDNTFCLGVDASSNGGNIIGVYAQQFYNFGFDMNAMTVSIQYIDCSLLED